jgi:hypothetical protein
MGFESRMNIALLQLLIWCTPPANRYLAILERVRAAHEGKGPMPVAPPETLPKTNGAETPAPMHRPIDDARFGVSSFVCGGLNRSAGIRPSASKRRWNSSNAFCDSVPQFRGLSELSSRRSYRATLGAGRWGYDLSRLSSLDS